MQCEMTALQTDISVIVVCLNAAATIGKALDSIVAAHAQFATGRLEVILVDGGSKDGTLEQVALRQTAIPDFRVIHQESVGIAAARNLGVQAATSSYIGFCDADDVWTRDAISLRHEALCSQPSAWAATGQVCFHDVEGDNQATRVRRVAGSTHVGYTPGALLVRREIFQSIGFFDESLGVGADSDWILRAAQALGSPLVLTETVLHKGIRAGSLSTNVETYRKEMLLIARRFLKRARQRDAS
jgi:glycosyltransferase involved in cell wall biosynthesis